MVEYLLNAIRANAGEDISVIASISEDGIPVNEGCDFMLHIDDNSMVVVDGEYQDGYWHFTIPAAATKDLKGRYSYCLRRDGKTLCFKEPFYLM